MCSLTTVFSWSQNNPKRSINVIYIGNSITQGALLDYPEKNAPPIQANRYLSEQADIQLSGFSNQGVSGMTTVDFLPAQQTFFPKIVEATKQFVPEEKSLLIYSIMLGTNDSAIKGPNGSPVSPVQYYTNMEAIINELLTLYPKAVFVLHRPIWYSPNTYNGGMYLQEGLDRLISYTKQINLLIEKYALTHPNHVFGGDTEAFEYFRTNYASALIPEDGNAGLCDLHPNQSGATELGIFWGKSIYNIIKNNKL